MSTDSPDEPPPAPSGAGWLRPVALILACLVLGFVAGWILRGDDGTVTVLETGAPTATTEAGANTEGAPEPAPPPATTEEAPPPERSAIALVVLNATGTAGLAGTTAAEAESLGYSGVIAGNAPTSTDPSAAYFTPGNEPAAQRVASDLRIDEVAPLPPSGPIADASREANPDAVVVVVLRP
jgi:hypothetical protein